MQTYHDGFAGGHRKAPALVGVGYAEIARARRYAHLLERKVKRVLKHDISIECAFIWRAMFQIGG